MSHPRQLIRDELTAILMAAQAALDAAAGAAVKIYNAHILTIDDSTLPAVSIIYTENQGGEDVDQVEQREGDYNLEERSLTLSVEVMTMKNAGKAAADQGDDICNVVENEVAKKITLNKKCHDIELFRVRFGSSAEGKGPARLIENLFRCKYFTNKAGA